MADKQPHLNGESRRYPKRSCICFILSIILTIVAFLIIAGIITWIVVQPRTIKFSVTGADLTQFDYDDDDNNKNTLNYNMVLNFTARNPNKKLSVYYHEVQANMYYEGILLNTTDVITSRNSFPQSKNITIPMNGVVFSGQKMKAFDIERISKFNASNSKRAFDFYVKVYFRISFRLGDSMSFTRKPKAKCQITVPLRSEETMTFFETMCNVDS